MQSASSLTATKSYTTRLGGWETPEHMAKPPHAVLPVITRGEQLTCEAAAAGSFETVFDLIPDSDVACIVGTDGRSSLSAAELRRFVEAGPVDSFFYASR